MRQTDTCLDETDGHMLGWDRRTHAWMRQTDTSLDETDGHMLMHRWDRQDTCIDAFVSQYMNAGGLHMTNRLSTSSSSSFCFTTPQHTKHYWTMQIEYSAVEYAMYVCVFVCMHVRIMIKRAKFFRWTACRSLVYVCIYVCMSVCIYTYRSSEILFVILLVI